MAKATHHSIRFHNLSNEALADALGHADAILKGADAECTALKDEIKRRGLLEAAGENFAIRVADQISGRLDVSAVKEIPRRILAPFRGRYGLDRDPHQSRHSDRGCRLGGGTDRSACHPLWWPRLIPRSSNPTRFEMSDKLDRRTMLTGAAFVSVLALPVGANAGSHGPLDCAPDPIFAAIEAHRKAFLECEDCGIEENVSRLSDIENDALCDLLEVTPTTLAGVVALSRYSAELTALFSRTGWDRPVTHSDDEERSAEWTYYIHRHVADVVLHLSSGAPP
jgi:hypothetical protein